MSDEKPEELRFDLEDVIADLAALEARGIDRPTAALLIVASRVQQLESKIEEVTIGLYGSEDTLVEAIDRLCEKLG